jgi:hypothetical protein
MRRTSTTRRPERWMWWFPLALLGALAACDGADGTETGAGGESGDGGDGGADDDGDGDGDDGDGDGDGDDGGVTVGVGSGAGDGACTTSADCDDGDPCTDDVCTEQVSGELVTGACDHEEIRRCGEGPGGDPPGDDGPDDEPEDPGGADSPIDPSCADGGGGSAVFLPFEPLVAPDLPASCEAGLEWQNCTTSFEQLTAVTGGSEARTLHVDLATYTAPDRLRITGRDASGEEYLLLDTCRVRTADYIDPTGGDSRPPDDSIRQFELELREGTVALTFDSSNAGTPFYMRVLGLCDFDLVDPGVCHYREAQP